MFSVLLFTHFFGFSLLPMLQHLLLELGLTCTYHLTALNNTAKAVLTVTRTVHELPYFPLPSLFPLYPLHVIMSDC